MAVCLLRTVVPAELVACSREHHFSANPAGNLFEPEKLNLAQLPLYAYCQACVYACTDHCTNN